ncbi:MAG: SPFH domain-containing protein [Candidatus Eisenbacteria bacterium]|nr:SPFH domain-containing protein [Candidatus Eisenbacteria bacterium]MCC7141985.1 SPFH domain-containing protein [Candidatus Eisenbacteria bacterium]
MTEAQKTPEREIGAASGWPMLVLVIVLFLALPAVLIYAANTRGENPLLVVGGILIGLFSVLLWSGFFVIAPNEARVLTLFGDYRGSVKRNGFFWTNPFMTKARISLRARTLNGERLKVNDKMGNPIEIAAVVVWQVSDTAKATFDVQDYAQFVAIQSETAVRHLTSAYPYDGGEDEVTLRGATDEVNTHLQRELQERLHRAGVTVIEARFSHLAYAAEIADAMLRRQQATAMVAARFKIVEGAVGMVEHALAELAKGNIVQLDEERKAAMVSNLLVVLCSESSARPVVNTGTLYP